MKAIGTAGEKVFIQLVMNICKAVLESIDKAEKSEPIRMEKWNIGAARNMARNLKRML